MTITTEKKSLPYSAQAYQSLLFLKVTSFFAIFAEIPARFVIHFRLLTITMWLSIGLFSILIFKYYGEITGDLHEEATRKKQAEEKRR